MNKKPRYINVKGRLLDLSIPKVMGIMNITPDSFYGGSRFATGKQIIETALKMYEDGADIIDIGGYSSRPGAEDVLIEEEGKRVFNAVTLIRRELPDVVISIDTFRADIAKEAVIGCGANIINDISGGEGDSKMFSTVASLNVPYILMHMQGNPKNMQNNTVYDDVVSDILKWIGLRVFRLQTMGVKDIIIDPGIGFGKTTEQNFDIIRQMVDFSIPGLPLLIGVSRKSMIWKTLEIKPEEALNGTTVLNTLALFLGADIIRVHDVKEARQVIKLISMLGES